MSIAELKKTADSLSAKEREWLRAYLFVNERSTSESWKKDMVEKRRKFEAGKGVSESHYKRSTAALMRKTP